ncbi:alpha/beta hydrolase [Kribbella sp. NBC_01245]|uniref:alpha/beta hydrolase n=1 Tax=Kribbella sp. NBC_01245 TaxID=2903578 RepID=UPI002E290CAE|nr:alpha/beta fold hydrolase [Kribbella sp. NBC_01245]
MRGLQPEGAALTTRDALVTTVLGCLALVLAGCGGSGGPSTQEPAPTSARPETAPATTPSASPHVDLMPLDERCGLAGVQAGTAARVITTARDRQLYAVGAGRGRLGVVLVHGSGSRGLCNWAKEIGWLTKAGLHVVGYDQACVGESACPGVSRPVDDLISVVAELRSRGATQVAVVGASAGGTLPLIAAARPKSGISAVVSLSAANLAAPLGTADAPDVAATSIATALRVPVLYVLARDDTASSVAEITALRKATRASRLILLPAGSGHAQEVLYDEAGMQPSTFRQAFLAFLHSPK